LQGQSPSTHDDSLFRQEDATGKPPLGNGGGGAIGGGGGVGGRPLPRIASCKNMERQNYFSKQSVGIKKSSNDNNSSKNKNNKSH
jgi:hypothetical protein